MITRNVRHGLAGLMGTLALLSACGSKPSRQGVVSVAVTGVTVETVHFQNMPEAYEAVGTVRSATTSIVGAQISGTVREIRVNPGDRVKRGEVLALLDDRSQGAQLAAAEARVEESKQARVEAEQARQAAIAERKLAEVTYHRYQELLAKNSVTHQEFDSAEARYRSAVANEAAVEARKQHMEARSREAQRQQQSAQTLFSYARVLSPMDGLVTAKSVDAGTLVMPGTPILTVEDTAHYRLEASVPEELISKIHQGQEVQVWAARGRFAGRVVEVVPGADPVSRTFTVKVTLPPKCPYRSGEYGKALFPVGERSTLAVARLAVVERGQLEGLYVVNSQGMAEYRVVKTGKDFGNRVEILSGLSDGEQVATSKLDRLADGVRVEAQ